MIQPGQLAITAITFGGSGPRAAEGSGHLLVIVLVNEMAAISPIRLATGGLLTAPDPAASHPATAAGNLRGGA
jgi:hypothetical protein